MDYVGLEFDSGVLIELKSGRSSWIEVDFKLNGVFILFDDFDKDVSFFEFNIEYGLKAKSDYKNGEKELRFR